MMQECRVYLICTGSICFATSGSSEDGSYQTKTANWDGIVQKWSDCRDKITKDLLNAIRLAVIIRVYTSRVAFSH